MCWDWDFPPPKKSYCAKPQAATLSLFPVVDRRDPVDGVEERLGAGLDAVGRDGPAAIQPAVVLHLDHHLALGVLADA